MPILNTHDFFWIVILLLICILIITVVNAILSILSNGFTSRPHVPSYTIPHLPPTPGVLHGLGSQAVLDALNAANLKVGTPINVYQEWPGNPPPQNEVDTSIPDEGDSFLKVPDRKPWT